MEDNLTDNHLPPPKPRMSLRAGLMGLIILLCGMIAGSALTFWGMSRTLFDGFGPPGKHMPEHITHKLQHELGLNQTQSAAVLDIFTQSHTRMEAIRHKAEPEIEAEMESVRVSVENVLTPEQRIKWNKRVEDMRRHRPHPPSP